MGMWGLVPDNVDNMESEAERILIVMYYYGERKRSNFERYVRIQKDYNHIIEGLKIHGHMGIDTRSQVRHLIQGIKITEFDTVKAQIMAIASLRTDYDECVYLYRTFINHIKKVSPPEMNISGVE